MSTTDGTEKIDGDGGTTRSSEAEESLTVRQTHKHDHELSDETKHDDETEPRSNKSNMQTLEIEMDDEIHDSLEAVLSLDDLEAEEAGLINGTKQLHVARQSQLCGYHKIEHSNCHVLLPRFFYKNGFGMVGPHWFGPLCILCILAVASYMFTSMGYDKCGPLTGVMSVMFTVMIAYNLLNTSLRDPGLVILNRQEPPLVEEASVDDQQPSSTSAAPRRVRQRWRWCDVCQAHQPPDAAHCPDCNVCIRGFDHHCVWMGVCIGRNNFKQFLRFNLSWLGYLAYCILWITLIGPLVTAKVRHAASGEH